MIAVGSRQPVPPAGTPCAESSGDGAGVSSALRMAASGAAPAVAPLDTTVFCLWLAVTLLAPVWFGSNVPLVWGIHAILFGGLLAVYGAVAVLRGTPLVLPLTRLGWPLAALAIVLLWAAIQTSSIVPAAWQYPI